VAGMPIDVCAKQFVQGTVRTSVHCFSLEFSWLGIVISLDVRRYGHCINTLRRQLICGLHVAVRPVNQKTIDFWCDPCRGAAERRVLFMTSGCLAG